MTDSVTYSPMRVCGETYAVHTVEYQRNGICGRGFFTIYAERDGMAFVIVRPCREDDETASAYAGECYVVTPDNPDLAWRGDNFAAPADAVIANHPYNQCSSTDSTEDAD